MAEPNEETKPASNAAKYAIPAIALLLGAGAGVGGAMLAGGGDEKPAAESAEKAEGAEAAPEAAEGGEEAAPSEGGEPAAEGAAAKPKANPADPVVTNIGAFTVNLRGGGGGRVLRIEVQVETSGASAPSVAARSAAIRDSVITAVSDYTWSDLEGTDGKVRLRDELLSRVNALVAPTVVEHMYFTQFVVQ
jgi:flagellar FliL protein